MSKMSGHSRSILRIALLILAVICVGVFATTYFYMHYKLIDYKELNTSVTVIKYGGGLNGDRDSLNFGANYPGGAGWRYFELRSDIRALVNMQVSGDMNNFLAFSENHFILEPNVTKKIQVNITIPEGTPLGEYSGKIKIYLLKP